MRYKKGVSVVPLQPQMQIAQTLLNWIIEDQLDQDFVITETWRDPRSSHYKKGSLHNCGLAMDIRKRDFTESEVKTIIHMFKRKNTDIRYQFVIKSDHIHLEYDRRVKNAI